MTSTLLLVADGWTFVQFRLLGTKDFVDAAKGRGFSLRAEHLASLSRRGLLSPFLAVNEMPVGAPFEVVPGPSHHYARYDIDAAATEARLTDPAVQPLADDWRFDQRRLSDPDRWWNGLLYSRWQLLQFASLTNYFTIEGQPLLQDGSWPLSTERGRRQAIRWRELAILLSAIESRYYPLVDGGWVRLSNCTHEEWDTYRSAFNPAETARRFGVSGRELVQEAENLLLRAKSLDPLGPWSRVVRQAPPKHQEKVRGLALLALGLRRAAEMLLLFAEDIGESSPARGTTVAAPVDDRISRHGESLESALQAVGVSPHTRVALIVEGATELLIARKILEHFEYGPNPDGLQMISMDGVYNKQRIQKLAAHLATPVITERYPDSYGTLRPLCQVIVVTDPEGPMAKPDSFRRDIIRLIMEGLHVQGVDDVDPESVDLLVSVAVLDQAFEYEHFTDQQIAEALLQLSPVPLPRDSTVDSATTFLATARAAGRNLKRDLGKLSKTRLAEKLWPTIRGQIEVACRDQSLLPPFADIVYGAHSMAVDAMNRTWILSRQTGEEASAGDVLAGECHENEGA